MGEYSIVAKSNTEWYVYQADENNNPFTNKEDAKEWAEIHLLGWEWHIAMNA